MEEIRLKDKLNNLRTARGYSMEKLGELAGVGQNTISRIESGDENPRIDTLRKIANALNVDVYYFLNDSMRTYFDIPEVNDALTNEIKELILSKDILPYMLLAKKAYDSKIPPDVVAELINTITKIRDM